MKLLLITTFMSTLSLSFNLYIAAVSVFYNMLTTFQGL